MGNIPGDTAMRRLAMRREVSMPGYVSSDTHIHTCTHSRHGDATVAERMATIAGEVYVPTGERTAIAYLMQPLTDSMRSSFREE